MAEVVWRSVLELARQFLEPRAGAAIVDRGADPLDRRLEPRHPHRLGEEIDRAGIIGERREARIGGGEDDQRAGPAPPRERLDHVEAVEPGHFDIEEDRVGPQRGAMRDHFVAVPERADELDAGNARDHVAQPLERERFVVAQEHADRHAAASR